MESGWILHQIESCDRYGCSSKKKKVGSFLKIAQNKIINRTDKCSMKKARIDKFLQDLTRQIGVARYKDISIQSTHQPDN